MDKILNKIYRAILYRLPLGEIISSVYGLSLHLLHSFNNRNPGIDKEKLRYYLVKHCHIIEKGLALPAPRLGFGQPKITELISKARAYEKQYGHDNITTMLRDMLRAYLIFHEQQLYRLPPNFDHLLKTYCNEREPAGKGGLLVLRKDQWAKYSLDKYQDFVSTRHSVRDFDKSPIDDDEVRRIIKASLNTPSVCNRQGWFVHYYREKETIRRLLSYQNGNSGFTECIDKLLIVTGNAKAFTRYEHNQLFIDGGLLSMNLMLALHAAGLGSCPLNTCMPFNKEISLKRDAGMANHEKLIMMIAIGRLKEEFAVAQSEKYSVDQVMKLH